MTNQIVQGNVKSTGHVAEGAYPRPSMSPPLSPGPGSPLQYGPQMVMEPFGASKGVPEDRGGPEFYAGQAAGPKLVPVVIVCESSDFPAAHAPPCCSQDGECNHPCMHGAPKDL